MNRAVKWKKRILLWLVDSLFLYFEEELYTICYNNYACSKQNKTKYISNIIFHVYEHLDASRSSVAAATPVPYPPSSETGRDWVPLMGYIAISCHPEFVPCSQEHGPNRLRWCAHVRTRRSHSWRDLSVKPFIRFEQDNAVLISDWHPFTTFATIRSRHPEFLTLYVQSRVFGNFGNTQPLVWVGCKNCI